MVPAAGTSPSPIPSSRSAVPAQAPAQLVAAADTTAPQTQITTGPPASTTATIAGFYFSASEARSSFTCRLDSGAWGRCVSPMAYTALKPGRHQFWVRATDAAGNLDPTPATRSWFVTSTPPPTDTTAPQTQISAGPTGSTAATSASLSFSATEAPSSFTCKLDSGAWGPCTSPRSYAALKPGSHQFSVRATDAAGNLDTTPATRSWTVVPPADTTAPQTQITTGPPVSTTATTASLAFSASEPGSAFTCKLDSGAWSSCVSPRSYAALKPGSHQFSVRATDAAGNLDSTPATWSWTVTSTTPPPTSGCTTTVSSVSSAQSALSSAAPGQTVCLADGTYGGFALSSSKAAPGVTLTAAHPGAATIGSVSVSGPDTRSRAS